MASAILIGNGVSMTGVADPGATVSKDDVAEFTDCIGVWQEDGVSGDLIAVALMGEYELDKETGVAFAVGDLLYWDATNDRLDATNTNIPAGIATRAAASAATRATVQLIPGIGA